MRPFGKLVVYQENAESYIELQADLKKHQ